MPEIFHGPDGKPRCGWCAATPAYIAYHDDEWGYPVTDDIRLFEKICLEGFQSGLSWRTILEKRENFRAAFAGFDPQKVSQFTEADTERLLQDVGIIRHRGKINATINNAARALAVQAEFGSLAKYFWSFEPETPSSGADVPSQTDASRKLSKDLKKRGWKFVGPTTAYAFMQAMGMVNDHAPDCIHREKAQRLRAELIISAF